ncbi:MAG: D-alanine--D-alanine ligase family protein [Candidatus Saccharimonadales bacterium]
MKKKTIAVFFGGVTPEHDISIVTAISAVIKPLELSGKYDVVPVYITKTGAWYSHESFKDITVFRTKAIEELCAKLKPLGLVMQGGLVLEKQLGLKRRQRITIDIAFPAMHGGNGEDGSLMGVLRMTGIPFVGCDIEASSISMDKVLAKQVVQAEQVPVAKYEYLFGSTFTQKPDLIVAELEKSLTYPLFVKPAHLGSSIGITRATNTVELRNALEVAAFYDDKVIVEEAVQNLIEVTLPIIGNKKMEVGLLERPLTQSDEFFDFDTKYLRGGKKSGGAKQSGAQGYSELPAKLSKELYDQAVATAQKVYRIVGCEGISRIDLLIDSKTEKIYFNEINPMPGSLYAHNWRKAGVSSVELVTKLVGFAEERHVNQQRLSTTFPTSFLKQF